MVYLDSAEKLRQAIEKKLGHKLADQSWNKINPDPDWPPPYGSADVKELVRYIRLENKLKTGQDFYDLFNDWSGSRLTNLFEWPVSDIHDRLARFQKWFLNLYGLDKPVSFRTIEETLLGLGATRDFEGIPIAYPKAEVTIWSIREKLQDNSSSNVPRRIEVDVEGQLSKAELTKLRETTLREASKPLSAESIERAKQVIASKEIIHFGLWDIDYLYIPNGRNHKLSVLPAVILMLCRAFSCNPAVALALLFCDDGPVWPINDLDLMMIKDGSRLQIMAAGPDVSPILVSRAYTLARNWVLRQRRHIQGTWARPRLPSERTTELIKFVEQSKKENWEDRLVRWNSAHTNWKYANYHSMQSAFYRRRKQGGKP